ncbi:hypothetical protein HJC23_002831 [Cyclotella cryptica]|uniref:ubiquitinyl hydrolase 1 n=1 Tax=Cyclotella cryptica TaxID=29204 RepID=A0ABD3PPM4_9STRA
MAKGHTHHQRPPSPQIAAAMSTPKQYWIYHERQDALLCGQHALNNLLQANEFSPASLAEIASQLDQMELAYMSQNNEGGINSKDYLKRVAEGSGNVDESGNFSIEVLRSALLARHSLELPNIRQKGILDKREITEIEGFICNRSSHWFAIRKINGRFWNLNSTNERPELISHFKLAAEMEALQNQGYSVFCVVDSLPPPCTNEAMMDQGLYWWKESDLLQGKSNAMTRSDDPWKDVGSGRRLDGKPKNNGGHRALHELSEEEQLQAAIQASIMDCSSDNDARPSSLDRFQQEIVSMDIGDEPASGGARVQIRLPDGKRLIRKFSGEDPVKVIYAFVAQSSEEAKGGRSFGLKAKFPPQDLYPLIESSISSCGLSGEAINVSWT